MEKAISAAEANRNFSRLLRDVKRGQRYLVTSHGRPVARIAPIDHDQPSPRNARSVLLDRLHSEKVMKIGRWRRDDLYE